MIKKLSETMWNCECGSLNAGYRTTCGMCDKPKTKQ